MEHALVSGASIAGLSTAYWLRRIGWRVTVLERAPRFRDGGQNVDVRGIAHEVLARMDLVDTVRSLNTTETDTVLVDEHGDVAVTLPSDGPDGATAELEVLRGDFARALLDQLDGEVELIFSATIATVEDATDRVAVTLDTGRTVDADVLVVAEGVRSSTRGMVFADEEVDEHELGITMAFGTIERTAEDDTRWRWYTAPGGRQVHLRPDNDGTTRAILAYAGHEAVDLLGLDTGDAVERLREIFGDAGWQASRVLDGFARSEDVYLDRLTQIRMQRWHAGRVCLAGDAAWCVTPIGGGGASLALTSGYVLAASLSTEPDVALAFEAYQRWMRPLVDSVQTLPPGINHLAYPRTRLGVRISRLAAKAMASDVLSRVTSKLMSPTSTKRELPPIAEESLTGQPSRTSRPRASAHKGRAPSNPK